MEKIEKNIVHISMDDSLDLEQVQRKLSNMGYERVSQVDMCGQYSVRGEIIDIFPATEETPVRIDLWDEEIDSIKYFDVESQRSIDGIDEITIYPVTEYILEKEEIERGIEKIK